MSKLKISSGQLTTIVKHLGNHPLKGYVGDQIKMIHDKIADLENQGSTLQKDEVRHLSKFLFEGGHGSYIGIESNLPSTYYEVYPDYLEENENYLKKITSKDLTNTRRVLIASSGGAIRTDAIMHPQLYRDFIEWHRNNKVGLYWIEEYKAEKIRALHSVDTTDVAFWKSSFAVTFNPKKNTDTIRIRLIRKNEPLFSNAQEYTNDICQAAQLLTLDTDKLPVISAEVVEQWEGYIGDLEFRNKGIGAILKKELSNNGRILDAASGSGYETTILAKAGYDVTANEIDPIWNAILRKKVAQTKIPVEVYQFDWRQLSSHLQPLYSGIIAVGNSLCMVIGKSQRQKTINEFYKLLKPGGKLIIDERNFDQIIEKLGQRDKCYSKGPMYACTTMNAELNIEDVSERLVRFSFFDVTTQKVLGSTIVQAPPKNEVKNMLKHAGFNKIDIYSDLRPGLRDNASIYTYVAIK